MGSAGGCHDAITVRIKCAWKSFRELLPILTNSAISPLHRGGIFSACVRRVMLHASETWPITVTDSARLVTADNAMVRWICKRKIADRVRMSEMHRILGIKDLESMMRTLGCVGMDTWNASPMMYGQMLLDRWMLMGEHLEAAQGRDGVTACQRT